MTGLPSHINIKSCTFIFTHEFRQAFAIARVESELIRAMQGSKEHARVVVEQGLSAISMVDVPVEDTDALEVEGLGESYLGSYSYIVEEAETSCLIVVGVMTWWSDNSIAFMIVSLKYLLDSSHSSSSRYLSTLKGLLALISLSHDCVHLMH